MIEKEGSIIDKLAGVWNDFLELDSAHPDEANDFRFHIHSLQRIIFSRDKIKAEIKIPDRVTCISVTTQTRQEG